MTKSTIQLHNLTKSYTEGKQSRVILDNVNVTFNRGEFVLLLGHSGSGKSTFIINDTAINRLGERQRTLFRREHIGFIFQFFNLIPTLTVFENITLALQLNGKISKDREQQVLVLLDRIGLSHRKDAFPDRLSGGEQQRVAILRAIAHNPTVLLADEPTGNLDEETGGSVMSLLLELTREVNKTLIMASHNPEIVPLADKVYRIKNGSLVLNNHTSPRPANGKNHSNQTSIAQFLRA